MIGILLAEAMFPFTASLGLLIGLLVLELISALLGGSLFGAVGEVVPDIDAPDFGDIDISAVEIDEIDFGEATEAVSINDPGVLGWLGLGKVPFLIWFAVLLAAFGLSGFALQNAVQSFVGGMLPLWIAVPIAGIIGILAAARFSVAFAALLPKVETTAVDKYHLARRRGIITQGTARRGSPAEVRVIDGHDNVHYVRAEPFRDGDELPQGTEVLILRDRRAEAYRLIAISEIYKKS